MAIFTVVITFIVVSQLIDCRNGRVTSCFLKPTLLAQISSVTVGWLDHCPHPVLGTDTQPRFCRLITVLAR
jgi:hypothetical protein